VDTKQA